VHSEHVSAVGDVVFSPGVPTEIAFQDGSSGQTQPHVEEFVRVRIDHSVQPKPMIVELNHSLAGSNVIRVLAVDRL
jgi:hypothetical protein